MDRFSRGKRSSIMAAIRSKGNRSTELALGRLLRASGVRGYRKHWHVVGRPDFAWPRLKVAVFVDGCFWHGCTRCKNLPETNADFWRLKIEENQRRDRRVTTKLRHMGWSVIRVKECSVISPSTLRRIIKALNEKREGSASAGKTPSIRSERRQM